MIAIGVGSYDPRELNLIATDPDTHVFTAQNFDELINLVTSLRRKTCTGKFSELRTFARKFSNIDFFLQILPLKDDELVMSEM